LTGGRLKKNWIPTECEESLSPLVATLDNIMVRLIETCSETVFGTNFEELAEKYDLPLISGMKKGKISGLTQKNFAMFDVAYYPNEKPTVEDLNVAGHFDPGLLSLSVLSTQPGLQVRNAAGEWIDCPTSPDLGIIWAGQLAQVICPDIKPGWHRVKYDENKIPRLSAWIEVCTKSQDLSYSSSIFDNVKFSKDGLFYLPGIDLSGYVKATEKIEGRRSRNPANDGKNPLNVVYVKEGESLREALHRASVLFGMPMSKTIRYYCPLCFSTIRDLESHFFEEHPSKLQVIPSGSEAENQLKNLNKS